MNVRRLRGVQKAILEHPERANLNVWLESKAGALAGFDKFGDKLRKGEYCGAVGCIAGWTVARAKRLVKANGKISRKQYILSFAEDAMELLGLTYPQAEQLFYPSSWPEDLRKKLYSIRTGTKKYAKIVSVGIDRFIANGGAWVKQVEPAPEDELAPTANPPCR